MSSIASLRIHCHPPQRNLQRENISSAMPGTALLSQVSPKPTNCGTASGGWHASIRVRRLQLKHISQCVTQTWCRMCCEEKSLQVLFFWHATPLLCQTPSLPAANPTNVDGSLATAKGLQRIRVSCFVSSLAQARMAILFIHPRYVYTQMCMYVF